MNLSRILVAPDSFKGTLSAAEAALAMQEGIRRALPGSTVTLHPVSDGGEGFLDVIIGGLGGTILESEVHGPLPRQRVSARWGLARDGKTAVIEMASAAGLMLIPPERRDPAATTTFGVGELMRLAMDRGVHAILIGIGGSGTNDGGAGMASALGARFLDREENLLAPGGAALADLTRIDLGGLDMRLLRTEVTVACDVTNPLTGPSGASMFFGPQKGGDAPGIALLEGALQRYAGVLFGACGRDVAPFPGSGAAGGLGAGLVAFCNARLLSGIDVVLDATGFDDELAATDLVVTGEGKIDAQTRAGKALAGILRRARAGHVPVVAVVGIAEGAAAGYTGEGGFAALATLVGGATTQEAAMRDAARILEVRTCDLMLSLRALP